MANLEVMRRLSKCLDNIGGYQKDAADVIATKVIDALHELELTDVTVQEMARVYALIGAVGKMVEHDLQAKMIQNRLDTLCKNSVTGVVSFS